MRVLSRQTLRQQAVETVHALEGGFYFDPAGVAVDLSAQLAASRASSSLHDLGELALVAGARTTRRPLNEGFPVIVANESSLEGARALSPDGSGGACCLVFASAKNPGGGFLRGSDAQEEALARATGLTACLAQQPKFYEANRDCGTALYTDLAIHMRDVPVIRDDRGMFLCRPWPLSMIVAPAPNRAAVEKNEPDRVRALASAFEMRIVGMLELARRQSERQLVLGAWGCGVFGWEPREVARIFAKALSAPAFDGAFDQVRFCIPDRAGEHAFRAFAETFA